jgi:hypothetical protein
MQISKSRNPVLKPCLYPFLRKFLSQFLVVVEKEDDIESQKHRWSERMIENVTGGVENAIHKVHFADP